MRFSICCLMVAGWLILPLGIGFTQTAASPAGSVTVSYQDNAQVELTSPQGVRVLIDVYRPAVLTRPARPNDILLTTHGHPDHINGAFLRDFAGPQLYARTGRIDQADVHILGLASAHNAGNVFKESNGTNYLYLIEMGPWRIAHLGDIGQNSFTDDQLAALGRIDILITQFDNSYSAMNAENRKGFNLVEQLRPALVIPTHTSMAANRVASGLWTPFMSLKPVVVIGRDRLTDQTAILFLGPYAKAYGRNTNATEW